MRHLELDRLRSAALRRDPFEYTVVSGFLTPGSVNRIIETYPDISKGGSYPLESLKVSEPLQEVIDELDGPEFESAIAEKFDVALAGMPKMYSLRGYCRRSDGKIHTDSKDKIVTCLLYLNRDWTNEGGKLRLLRNASDLDDYAEEVSPDDGTLLVFKRSNASFHGHGPFEGVRRSIQMNWMTSQNKRTFHKLRHTLSAGIKRIAAAE